jgi:hypothetical protein
LITAAALLNNCLIKIAGGLRPREREEVAHGQQAQRRRCVRRIGGDGSKVHFVAPIVDGCPNHPAELARGGACARAAANDNQPASRPGEATE